MDFEKDAEETTQAETEAQLDNILGLGRLQVELEQQITDLEDQLDEKKKQLKEVQERELPQLLESTGVEGIQHEQMDILVKEEVRASISKKNSRFAFDWLRDHDHADIIKNEISIRVPAGEDDAADEVMTVAESVGLQPERKETVHAGTLKAFVKEMRNEGEDLPEDLLGIYIQRKTTIKIKGK